MLYLSILLLMMLLLFPQICIQGASSGLLLWFNTIIPTLFPFLLITNVIAYKNGFRLFEKLLGPLMTILFRTSSAGAYPVITGLLCGYPMGAKATCDSFAAGRISKNEANYLLTFSNNPSPIFIANYVCLFVLENKKSIAPCLLIIYLSSVITAWITYKILHMKSEIKNTLSQSIIKKQDSNLSFFDQCITNACDTLVHIGGYMMIFSIISGLISNILPISQNITLILSGILEQTTALNLLKTTCLSVQIKTVLAMCFAGFGGLSILAQTYSIIHRHGLSLKNYLIGKSVFTIICGILTFIYQSISS